jgi:hypothetical protein
MKRLLVFALSVSALASCSEDDPIKKPIDPVVEIIPTPVNYSSVQASVSENSEGAYEVTILLSEAAQASGSVEVAVNADETEGAYFSTDPLRVGGKILLPVAKGSTEVSFKVIPVNNTKLNGNKAASFSIVNATGAVTLGESLTFALTIVDDELAFKPLSSETAGIAPSKRTYEYNVDGLVSKVTWEARSIHGITQGTDTYFYEDGKITRVEKSIGLILKYTWDDDRIVKMEQMNDENVMQYSVYTYDETGAVERTDNFLRQPAGDYALASYSLYSYHGDGNIHQIKNYFPVEDEFVLNSTFTYREYIDGHNTFPLVSILPNQTVQTKLPTYYSHQTQSSFLEYAIAYELTPEGYPTKREISGPPAGAGVTTFSYY